MTTAAENVTLQGYAVTGLGPATASQQAIATQGYAAVLGTIEGRRVVNLTGGPGSSSLTGGRVES